MNRIKELTEVVKEFDEIQKEYEDKKKEAQQLVYSSVSDYISDCKMFPFLGFRLRVDQDGRLMIFSKNSSHCASEEEIFKLFMRNPFFKEEVIKYSTILST